MRKHGAVLFLAIAGLALAACGTSKADRVATGAGIGAGVGAVVGLAFFGGAGAIPGALIGGGAGGAEGFILASQSGAEGSGAKREREHDR